MLSACAEEIADVICVAQVAGAVVWDEQAPSIDPSELEYFVWEIADLDVAILRGSQVHLRGEEHEKYKEHDLEGLHDWARWGAL